MRACPRCLSAYVGEVEHCGLDGARIVDTDRDPLLGQLIDRYEVLALLGRGAMGAVYRVRHTVLERDFAMKVLFGDLAANRTFSGRFRREAQALSKLRHSNVVAVSDFGTTQAGLTYLVMDYVEGTTLAEVIRLDAPLYAFRAARIVRQIAAALAEAHRQGLIHRDVKPENILLVREGDEEVVKLVDFGIVALDEDAASTKLTGLGRVVGTPTYMAPEQSRPGAPTPSADLYALGVILYELLAGRPPFDGSVPELLVRHALEAPAPLPPTGGLEALAARLLAKEPEGRPPSAHAVILELDGLVLDWSGVSNVTPLTAAVPIARSLSGAGLRRASDGSASEPARALPAGDGRTLETPSLAPMTPAARRPAPFFAPGPLAADLAVPPPSGASARPAEALPFAEPLGAPEPASFEPPDPTPRYDPFLQPDPYYSNLVDEPHDGLIPRSVAHGGSSGFSQDLTPSAWREGSPVALALEPRPVDAPQARPSAPEPSAQPTPLDLEVASLPIVGGSVEAAREARRARWQRLGPLLAVVSLVLSLVALALAVLLPRAGSEPTKAPHPTAESRPSPGAPAR